MSNGKKYLYIRLGKWFITCNKLISILWVNAATSNEILKKKTQYINKKIIERHFNTYFEKNI